jgi:predicted transcriptional regulator
MSFLPPHKLKLLNLVNNNPGRTSVQLAKIVDMKYGTISSDLHEMVQGRDSVLVRKYQTGMRGGKSKAYRYYVRGKEDDSFGV